MQFFRRIPLNFQQKRTFSSRTTPAQFGELIDDWWNPHGPAKGLHAMNNLRVPLVRNGLIKQGAVSKENINSFTPLRGLFILDVGCGGGILSEALALLGAKVTGIDMDPKVIELAKFHAQQNNLSIDYRLSSIEEHAMKNVEKFDAVVASEVIGEIPGTEKKLYYSDFLEHVKDKVQFIDACEKSLKPSGSIFLTTLSKTIFTEMIAIHLFENVFNFLPKGTHQIEDCIEPEQLQKLLENSNSVLY
ncbi:unnamed protein product [Ceutorhynchus assimilis]|uniref:Methyltransferase domain-containing protein n=1 Tax=Ceutorhynchus assimilis TaxID=467358 RepID=A0A9P0GMZ8_9CUCU|nr:unnamed protein product [Ceutorhynchus assimilis]